MNESTQPTRASRLARNSHFLGVLALLLLLLAGGCVLAALAGASSPGGPTRAEATSLMLCATVCQALAFVASLVGFALGIAALVDIPRGTGKVGERGRAVKALVTATVPLLALVVVHGVVLPILAWKAEKDESANNLKALGIAMHLYYDNYGHLPAAHSTSKDGKPLLSWRVHILPFIEQDNLYREFHLDEPWDSPHNKTLLAHMPAVFALPGRARGAAGLTHYQLLIGPGAVFERPEEEVRISHFPREPARTILMVEATDAVPWTKPVDLPFAPDGPLPKVGGLMGNGFHASFGDASVRWIEADEKENALRTLVPRDGR